MASLEVDESGVRFSANGFAVTKKVVETETVAESVIDSSPVFVTMEKEEKGVCVNDVVMGFPVNLNGVVNKTGNLKEGKKKGAAEANLDANGKKQRNNNAEKNRDFHVGDFVWGKIKSHPWWPGQIYDPKDASEIAVKHSQEGRLLVAFFGDGSCSWCSPSQLVPFVDNFKRMSNGSSSKSFHNAIHCALNDLARLVELSVTCECVPLDKRDGLARPIVSNAGIRKGVLVPNVEIGRINVPNYGSTHVLDKLMSFAKCDSFDSFLELAVLKCWLSAFYRSRGGQKLPVYQEPVWIEGLEDKNKSVKDLSGEDFSVPIAVPILGPQKSVAELMGKRAKESILDEGKSEDRVKNGSLSRKQKENEVGEGENISCDEIQMIYSRRERKKSKYLSPPYTNPSVSLANFGSNMKSGSDKSTKRDHSNVKSRSDKSVDDEAFDGELTTAQLKDLDTSNQKSSFLSSDVYLQGDELLSEVPVNPLYLSKKNSLDPICSFISAIRRSAYFQTGGKKRKTLKNQENGDTPKKAKKSADDSKMPKAVKKKSEGRKARAENSAKNFEGSASTCLIVTFSPRFPLPNKEQIVRLFGKFGRLNEKETKVFAESHAIRIVYTKESDAEIAFILSVRESPFDVENVNYWLKHSSSGGKQSEPLISARAYVKPCSSQPVDEFMVDVRAIRQKLEIMSAILENYHPKFLSEEKSGLKDDVKQLMENVETFSDKVQLMAENTITTS
ncbi:Tudor/PWWP/MBT superfamily protein [Striga hermonthica]|uniref:Tudor/PWWP/MBT superfamily protein n=1 Tax=Striga hermonthica TaxID=68872 RepID=A0A9N7MZ03_STRHE|nr:Tudor/PWWP/MBT superfamily protein [Striga hermonthica]